LWFVSNGSMNVVDPQGVDPGSVGCMHGHGSGCFFKCSWEGVFVNIVIIVNFEVNATCGATWVFVGPLF
jgi:hypothetical protein